ncbi:Hypothetical protein ADU72_0222 [Pediococcus damnosus]|uniref:DUF4440 domain-containing protein n=1 Tax=Pediococcus damnosus TaxID=51663 RepID=A0A143AW72_9LACO|nr:nuclear transport factor 2 family protein [Pediococcus damnosus]AMV61950.1 Hypothetical protein ADU70_0450 [Pediococcus damnosus]AMV66171.1 Hypothetical protein ADU72_0222 [Pediococcus damnosus]AMV68456.1 Hypothetical protein ADU73_0044 [Pediococcus damnosus]KJU74334.1 hypothetical protein AH70_07195 [Pediococcus damnosus LMG 28219]PIO80240.1 DUF4440 domain-containing protein [Pediococcus damnosus]
MNEQDKKLITQLYRDHNRYMVAGDTKKLGALLADNFHLVHMTGMVQTKAEWLGQIDSKQMNYFSSTEEHVEIKEERGNKATLIGQSQVDASIHGSRNTWPLQLNLHVEKLADGWKIMNIDAEMY